MQLAVSATTVYSYSIKLHPFVCFVLLCQTGHFAIQIEKGEWYELDVKY
jgi:hypothetical protein